MSIPPVRSRGPLLALTIAAAAGIVLTPVAWTVSDRLEQDNDFCLGCHLAPGIRLHAAIGSDFEREPPASLASLHASVGVEAGEDGGFRCIDCHGGASWAGRARVKLLAAKDAFWYATGRFTEPAAMAWPLWDEDCLQCHEAFGGAPSQPWETPRFHEVAMHNENLGVDCVECHRAHDSAVDPEAAFLRASWVQTQCARCHSEFVDEDG